MRSSIVKAEKIVQWFTRHSVFTWFNNNYCKSRHYVDCKRFFKKPVNLMQYMKLEHNGNGHLVDFINN